MNKDLKQLHKDRYSKSDEKKFLKIAAINKKIQMAAFNMFQDLEDFLLTCPWKSCGEEVTAKHVYGSRGQKYGGVYRLIYSFRCPKCSRISSGAAAVLSKDSKVLWELRVRELEEERKKIETELNINSKL